MLYEVITAVAEIDAPIKFIGTGEGVDNLETFDPKKFISRLLGMGDLDSLLERTEDVMDESTEESIDSRYLCPDRFRSFLWRLEPAQCPCRPGRHHPFRVV